MLTYKPQNYFTGRNARSHCAIRNYISRVCARNVRFGSLDTNWEFLSFGAGGFGDML